MPEARIAAGCVTARLREATIVPGNAEATSDRKNAVALRAGRSRRTLDRIMDYPDDRMMSLADADELLLAAGGHLSVDCPEN